MKTELRYIELKSGYFDNGPAWIGKVKLSKSGQTVYFHDKAFQKSHWGYGNHHDIETGEKYWISGVKKSGSNRHPCGQGKIIIAKAAVEDFLVWTNQSKLDMSLYEVEDIPDIYPVERVSALLNQFD